MDSATPLRDRQLEEALDRRSTPCCCCGKRSDSLSGRSSRSNHSHGHRHGKSYHYQGHSRSSSGQADLAHGLSTPSDASSLGLSNPGPLNLSPLRRELPYATLPDDAAAAARASRHAFARRLSQLAQHLTYGGSGDDDVDELALGGQLDRLEQALAARSPETRRPASVELRSRSKGGSAFGSPVSSLFRSRFSDLSASLCRERESQREHEREQRRPKTGMTVEQAKKVVAEMGKLNDELSTVISNLRARQEESDHIHGLFVERAERAAQRIIFLQNHISYLEQELQENDDELQHLRICLKAVEIQMPPHPDKELQRCIATFKRDYQALKKKRANRLSLGSSGVASPAR